MIGRFHNFDTINEAAQPGKVDVYFLITSPSKRYGYWDEVLTGSKKKQTEVMLKEFGSLKKIEDFTGPLTLVEFETGTVGSGEANYDCKFKATMDAAKVPALLKDKKFLKGLDWFMGGIIPQKGGDIVYPDDLKNADEQKKVLKWLKINESDNPLNDDNATIDLKDMTSLQFYKLIDLLEADILAYDVDDLEYYTEMIGIDIPTLMDLYAAYGYNTRKYVETDKLKNAYMKHTGKTWEQIKKEAEEAE